jgi:hypothetical protein
MCYKLVRSPATITAQGDENGLNPGYDVLPVSLLNNFAERILTVAPLDGKELEEKMLVREAMNAATMRGAELLRQTFSMTWLFQWYLKVRKAFCMEHSRHLPAWDGQNLVMCNSREPREW